METRRWYNSSLPQTLQLSQILLYLNAVSLLLFGLLAGGIGLIGILLIAGEVFGAYGIANSRRVGYRVGIGFAALALAFYLLVLPFVVFNLSWLLNIMFAIALFVALVHPQSRDYQKIWFS